MLRSTMRPSAYLSRWRSVFAVSAGILVASAMSLGAYTGQSAAQTTGPVQAIAAGDQHSLAIVNSPSLGSGMVWGWGANWNGQLGNGSDHNNYLPPTRVVDASGTGYFTGATTIDGGANFSLALRNDGTVWDWGNGSSGQLGVNSNNDHNRPVQVHGVDNDGYLTGIVTVAAGGYHSLAIDNGGYVLAWGDGASGQLGVNSDNRHETPVNVHGINNEGYFQASAVAGGEDFSLALGANGNVYGWGNNKSCQLGHDSGVMLYSHTPVQVPGISGVVAIAAGSDFGLALKNDGTVWAWGGGSYGELGVNSNNVHATPVQVHGLGNVDHLTGIVGVAAGESHSLAVGSNGSVYSWGRNNHGQLGVHSDNNHFYPVQVHGLGNVGYLGNIEQVAAGEFFSMGLKNDGTAVYAWGGNSYGQIDGSLQDHTYPVEVHGVAGAQEQPGPQITQVVPSPGAVNVARGRPVVATFSAKMDEASVEMSGTFTLVKEGTTAPVEAKVTYNAATKQATLNPVRPLEKGATYTATVSTQATDEVGNPLRQPTIWSFTARS